MVEIKARTPIKEGRGRLEELAADPHNVRTGAQRDPVEVDSRSPSSRMLRARAVALGRSWFAKHIARSGAWPTHAGPEPPGNPERRS